ncbi:phospho-sugar mutase [Protaetiibacter intestinalis]|uniref:Phospho-sugar mutase n=1 Tax=Protaetiibacter intestinalis TaxID=2419774 RepID=A0A387BIE4_9MICO|nr:phospho-sugar mutase [Protaetiibacter intestinalis]AYF98310.1 phospho-sugar mutase [Protaetiibacter intestinalis]
MTLDAVAAARAWAAQDPDEVTRAQLEALLARVDAGDPDARAELETRFAGRLTFGTAGLRGELGAGPLRMNRVLVGQAAAGLARYLLAREAHPSVVIGYDGRRNSEIFARDTAELMAGAGVRAILLPRLLPTPVLAFAVRHLGTSAGVMVTASHNPAPDNGYKVYLGGLDHGSQIVPPADAEIEAAIVAVAAGSIAELPRSDGYELAGEEVVDEYVRRTAAIAGAAQPLRVVYTAMHGVGWDTARRVFAEAGFPDVVSVPEQQEPDPAFPTVDFPNPEEPGAMDLAFAAATASGAELVIANDPDADRVAVGVPDGAGGWRRLSGNEVGWLLGWRAVRQGAERDLDRGTLACSLVSSPALGVVARKEGLDFAETLTGFKWISRVGDLVYGYEEALGYLVDPEKVRDKDGISAAVAVLALFSELKATGLTFAEHEAAFADRYGAFASGQISIRVTHLDRIGELMARLRAAPPREVGGIRVERIDDFAGGFAPFPPSDILRLWLAGGSRVIVRPSGTEPKLKCYLDTRSDEGTPAERQATADAALASLEAGMRELLAG